MTHDDEERPPRGRLVAGGLALAAAAAAAWWARAPAGPPPLTEDQARAIAAAFLDDVRGGRADAAWAGTSAEFKSLSGRDHFRRYVRSRPVLRSPAEFERFERSGPGGPDLATCVFRPAAGKAPVSVVLAPEAGRWKVERLVAE